MFSMIVCILIFFVIVVVIMFMCFGIFCCSIIVFAFRSVSRNSFVSVSLFVFYLSVFVFFMIIVFGDLLFVSIMNFIFVLILFFCVIVMFSDIFVFRRSARRSVVFVSFFSNCFMNVVFLLCLYVNCDVVIV